MQSIRGGSGGRDARASTMRKVYLRLLPFAMLCYILAYIDRINVSFAALTMRGDLEHVGRRLRLRRRHVLLGLLPVRSAEQRDPGEGRRAHLDRAHHDHLGHLRRGHGLRHRHDELRHRALPARHGRGGLLPRPHPLFHLLVPGPSPRPHRLGLPGRPADRGGAGRADLDGAARAWMACSGSRAGRSCTSPKAMPTIVLGVLTLLRDDRQAGAGDIPDAAGERLAGRQASPASARPRKRCASTRCSNRCSIRRCCCWR